MAARTSLEPPCSSQLMANSLRLLQLLSLMKLNFCQKKVAYIWNLSHFSFLYTQGRPVPQVGKDVYSCLIADNKVTLIYITASFQVEHHPSDTFTLQLDFRTLKEECVLAYSETSSGVDRGHIQVRRPHRPTHKTQLHTSHGCLSNY